MRRGAAFSKKDILILCDYVATRSMLTAVLLLLIFLIFIFKIYFLIKKIFCTLNIFGGELIRLGFVNLVENSLVHKSETNIFYNIFVIYFKSHL